MAKSIIALELPVAVAIFVIAREARRLLQRGPETPSKETTMILPQSEARFKLCPMLASPDGKLRTCQGAQCMMWCYKVVDQKNEDDPGYCGLAGKPSGAM